MNSALLAADTSAMPDGTVGYEGTQASGFRAAANHILWGGDAGLGASLDDMIAWERHIDATRDDPDALYSRLSRPVSFADGTPAEYGFGLSRSTEFGRSVSGHGGALRGWRSHRLYVPSERISVVVLFNHVADARAAAIDLLAAVLDEERPTPDATIPAPVWLGAYVEPETGLAVRIDAPIAGRVRLRFGHTAEQLDLQPGGSAGGSHGTLLRFGDGGLWMHRPHENQASCLRRCEGAPTTDVAGRYHCEELDTELTVADTGGALWGLLGLPGPGAHGDAS
jgi:D-aminopeptidase